jgi:TaqI-like C-terminal specificity domain
VEYSQGVIPYKTKADGQANKYISATRRGREWLSLIENASQVRRYHIETPSAFIHYGPWLWCARAPRFFTEPKILFHRLRKKLPRQLVGAYDDTGAINRHSLSNLILRPGKGSETLLAVLGLLNSELANWWFVKRYGLLMEVAGFKVSKMPLPPKWDDATGRMAALVDRMLEMNKRKRSGGLAPSELERLDREIAATDSEIDSLVYELCGITDEERKTIEGEP